VILQIVTVNQKGFTILETMVALCVLAIVLLGVNATMFTVVKMSSSIYYSQLALQQQSNIIEMLTAYNGNNADELVASWNKQNAEVLPGGSGEILGAYPDYKVQVYWNNLSS
jgi:prepilin-type N-terminal cleavage/methylation domain-containing protein